MSDTPSPEESPEAADDAASAAGTPPRAPAVSGEPAAPSGSDDAKKKKKKLVGNLVFAVGFVATLGVGYFAGQYLRDVFGEKPEIVAGERFAVELRGDEPQVGPDDALVTIVEFSDFECPYCAKAAGPIDAIVEEYEGKVRVIFKHYPLPFHRNALPAAFAGWAAHRQGKFWEVHDRLFAAHGSIAELPAWLTELGLDAEKFAADMESAEAKAAVDSDYLAGGRAGIRSTPSFLVNGHPYSGARDERYWRAVIDAELEAAEALGVDAGEVYATLMKDAKSKRGGGESPGGPPSERRAAKRRPGEPDPARVYDIPTDQRPSHGPDDALVTIVEFSDYHCPFCARAHRTIDALLAKYPEDLRVVHRQRPLPIHPHAKDAAKVALAAARQGKFDELHGRLFELKGAGREQLEKEAVALGLDAERLAADLADPKLDEMIREDGALADHFGTRATPAFFVNGRFLGGAQSLEVFSSVIDEELEKARARVDAGTARADLYEAIRRDAEKEVAD